MKIGLIREGKTPPDKRVALNPKQCEQLLANYPQLEIAVQPSNIRCYSDDDYADLGISLQNNLSDCDIIFGVKEVPINYLIPNKTFFFFSHTIKEQDYNQKLIKALIKQNIQLVDYEVLTRPSGSRLIGFGRFAGIVGAYNGFLSLGKRHKSFDLKPAYACENKAELDRELKSVELPEAFKLVITGRGRVALGALEIIEQLDVQKLDPEEYINYTGRKAVYCHIDTKDYAKAKDGSAFSDGEFRRHPTRFESNFLRFAHSSDMFIAGHYYGNDAPYFFTRKQAKDPNFRIRVVADISCDINGPVASTIKPSTIADPIYGYNPQTEKEDQFDKEEVITVMAVDNLPCELPKDASDHFGSVLLKEIIPALLVEDPDEIIERATICKSGNLGSHFSYLHDYAFK
ncbi:MAG: NAD(P)-dependent oxidoreductase [Flavobacteriales bacterium]